MKNDDEEHRLNWDVPWDEGFELAESLDPSQRLAAACGVISSLDLNDDGKGRFNISDTMMLIDTIGMTLIGWREKDADGKEIGLEEGDETDDNLHECFARSMHDAMISWMEAHEMIAPSVDSETTTPEPKVN